MALFDFGPYNNANQNPWGNTPGMTGTSFVDNQPAFNSPGLSMEDIYASLGLPAPQPLAPMSTMSAPSGTASVAAPGGNGGFSFANPFYASVIAPILNEQGQQTGTVPLANNQFATPDMAAALLNYLSSQYGLKNGQVVKSTYSGPTAPSEAELGIRFGNSPVINAGLEYQRLQNANGYSQPYLDAQFADTLSPGSSGWSNYANGGQAMTSADAERAYANNPATDPNANILGQAWKYAQTNGAYSGPTPPAAPQTQTGPAPTYAYDSQGTPYIPWGGYYNNTPPATTGRGTPNTTQAWLSGGGTSGGTFWYPNPDYTGPYTPPPAGNVMSDTPPWGSGGGMNTAWRSWPGSTGFQGYASALNGRRPPYSGNYSTRPGPYTPPAPTQAPAAPTWTNPSTSETGGSYMNTRSMNNSYNRVTANPYGR